MVKNYQSATVNSRRPLVIAHRGASGLAPENTLAAFRLAIALGADGVEMDVQLSADGQPVVIHDARVNRTTNGRGPVASFTSDQLGRLDAGGWFERRLSIRPRLRAMLERATAARGGDVPGFACESVPTLEVVLALLAPAKLARIYIELKSAPANRMALLRATVSLVRQFGLEPSVTLLSFDHEAVSMAKGLAPEIRSAATFPITGRTLVTARRIIRSTEGVGADEVALHYGLATRRIVGALEERGLSVSVWTVNRPLVMRRLIARGVDAIMTNFPDQLIQAIDCPTPRRLSVIRRNGRTGRRHK